MIKLMHNILILNNIKTRVKLGFGRVMLSMKLWLVVFVMIIFGQFHCTIFGTESIEPLSDIDGDRVN